VISGLLDAFKPLIPMREKEFRALCEKFVVGDSIYSVKTKGIVKTLTRQPALIAMLPKKHVAAYLDATKRNQSSPIDCELFHRAHLIVDFVSGMTDEFALSTYRLMSGQRIYGHNT
jgi:dGTPase